MGNNNYSDNSQVYSNNLCNNYSGYENGYGNGKDKDKDKDCDNHDDRNRERCCGRRFNNRSIDKKVARALEAFEKQLFNTDEAIECLNKLFNNLEDAIFEDRCCPSNRIKNILRSIQTDICDLQDDVRDIRDDVECLEQAL